MSLIPSPVWTYPDVVFTTGSCLSGCDGLTDKQSFHVTYPNFILEQKLPIHSLEMLALLIAIRL